MKEIMLTSSVLIGIVMLLRWLLRGKVSQRLLYGIWLLVALRLLIPFQFGQLSFSINTLSEQVISQSETYQQVEALLYEPVIKPQPIPILPGNPPVSTPSTKAEPSLTLAQALTALWLLGIGGMALWFLLTNLHFQQRAKRTAKGFSVDTPIRVYVSHTVPTPCLLGLFRPVIYLTPTCADDPRMLHHVLTHELTHWHHKDHIWSLVRCICLCIYWFNPLVWLAAAQSKRDCELACDEHALITLGDPERIAYGETLLATVSASRTPSNLLKTATSMNESKKQLRERMCFIVKKPRNLLIAAIALVLVVALAAGCAFSGSTNPEKPTQPQPNPTVPTAPLQKDPTPPVQTAPTTTQPSQTDDVLIPEPHSLFPPATPIVQVEAPTEAQLIAKEVIKGEYFNYIVYGVCCDLIHAPEPGYVDMSQYLTKEQKEDYHNYQKQITCCKTAKEVQAHIDRYVGKDAQCLAKYGYPKDKLFTDNEGQLYLIVTPTEYDNRRHFEVISQTKKQIVVRACRQDELDCWFSEIYTIEISNTGYLVTKVEEDREYKCEITTLHEEPNYQLYKHGNTGYSGAVYAARAGTLHVQEDFYCPAVTQVSENIWEIATDYGNGFVKRIYFGRAPSNSAHKSGHETYYYAIALGHGKIAYLDGELNSRTLVVCDLFNPDTAQIFTELDFKAENMPVTAAAFSEHDTQLTLTYYTNQNTQTTVTLELNP